MYIDCEHRTASCPSCGKDTGIPQSEAVFTVVECIYCGVKFTKGKVVKK